MRYDFQIDHSIENDDVEILEIQELTAGEVHAALRGYGLEPTSVLPPELSTLRIRSRGNRVSRVVTRLGLYLIRQLAEPSWQLNSVRTAAVLLLIAVATFLLLPLSRTANDAPSLVSKNDSGLRPEQNSVGKHLAVIIDRTNSSSAAHDRGQVSLNNRDWVQLVQLSGVASDLASQRLVVGDLSNGIAGSSYVKTKPEQSSGDPGAHFTIYEGGTIRRGSFTFSVAYNFDRDLGGIEPSKLASNMRGDLVYQPTAAKDRANEINLDGLFTIYDGETLRRGGFTFSIAYSNYDRDPGEIEPMTWPVTLNDGSDLVESVYSKTVYRGTLRYRRSPLSDSSGDFSVSSPFKAAPEFRPALYDRESYGATITIARVYPALSIGVTEDSEHPSLGLRWLDLLVTKTLVFPNQPPTASLEASALTISAPCGARQQTNVSHCSANPTSPVRLRTTASDPDGDSLLYSYKVTAGRIVGEGAAVTWELGGLSPGIYTASVEADDGCGSVTTASVTIRVVAALDHK